MKTTHILSLGLAVILLLLPLAACQPKTGEMPMSVETPEMVEVLTYDELTPTDSLVLYVPVLAEAQIQSLINRYQALYEVEVEIVRVEGDYEEYAERVANDLVGGIGPDVLFLNYLDMDIAKSAQNHNFLDLTGILAGDESFSESNYIDGVFEAGRFDGRQYTVPTSFFLPLFLSAQTKLEELGFDWNQIEKTSDFLEKISDLTSNAQQNPSFQQMMQSKNYVGMFDLASGVSLLDYENNVVLPDEEALSKYLHAYKAYFPYDYDESGRSTLSNFGADNLVGGRYLFWLGSLMIADLPWNMDALIEASCGYELSVLPSQNGEIVGSIDGQMAINANTKNPLNAYRFIKMMLSADVQSSRTPLLSFIPIHEEAIKAIISGTYTFDVVGTTYGGRQSAYLTEEELDEIIKTLTEVDQFIQPISSNVSNIIWKSMLPFLQNEKSYEDCLSELRNKLTLYLSE